jgi:enamine deaminase RidA (YjgF/YER057c/UK114 family)
MSSEPSVASNARRIERTALAAGLAAAGVGYACFAAAIGVALLRLQLTLTALVVEWSPLGTAVAISLGILFGVVGWDWLGVGAIRLVTKLGYNLLGSPDHIWYLRKSSKIRRTSAYFFASLFLLLPLYGSTHRFARIAPVVGGDAHRVFDPSHSAGSAAVLLLDFSGALGIVACTALLVAAVGATAAWLGQHLATGNPSPAVVARSLFIPQIVREREASGEETHGRSSEELTHEDEHDVDWETMEVETRAYANDFLVRLCMFGVLTVSALLVIRRLASVTPSVGFGRWGSHLLAFASLVLPISFLRGVHLRVKMSEWTPTTLVRLGSFVDSIRRIALCRNTGVLTEGVVVCGYLATGIWMYLSAVAQLPSSRSDVAPLLRVGVTSVRKIGGQTLQPLVPAHAYAEATRVGAVFVVCAAVPLVVSWARSVRQSPWSRQIRSTVDHLKHILATPVRILKEKTKLTGEDARLSPWSFWIKTTVLAQGLLGSLVHLSYLRQNPVIPGLTFVYTVGAVQAAAIWQETNAREEYDAWIGGLIAVSALLIPFFGGLVYLLRNY